jgi:hypothetical protein
VFSLTWRYYDTLRVGVRESLVDNAQSELSRTFTLAPGPTRACSRCAGSKNTLLLRFEVHCRSGDGNEPHRLESSEANYEDRSCNRILVP